MNTKTKISPAMLSAADSSHKLMALQRAQEQHYIDVERRELLEQASEDGVGVVHIKGDANYGGLTVAFMKSNEYKSGTMVTVAVVTCSRADAFSKKTGTLLALRKFYDAETVQLPLLCMYEERDMAFAVKEAFTAMYNAVT